ncbi:hypothetical protein Pve01_79490 [Planomonospora venezuelensis]|nr:hypothetical protein Pve01_79490 [Planomonospora venezuelensis]
MPSPAATYSELGSSLELRPDSVKHYTRLLATSGAVLDVGGRNKESESAARLVAHGADLSALTCTDILEKYEPDLVDDITATNIPPESFDGVYCLAVLEHVTEYPAAVANIRTILRPGGQALFYVPFMYDFHDEMDYHRFTITELKRMLNGFSEVKVFAPQNGGYGWLLLYVLTYGVIEKWPHVHNFFAKPINSVVGVGFRLLYRLGKRGGATSADQLAHWGVHLNFNHGFYAWVRK